MFRHVLKGTTEQAKYEPNFINDGRKYRDTNSSTTPRYQRLDLTCTNHKYKRVLVIHNETFSYICDYVSQITFCLDRILVN